MRKDQNGFGAGMMLLVAVLAGVIIFTGWYVAQSRDRAQGSDQSGASSQDGHSSVTDQYKPAAIYRIVGADQYVCTKSANPSCRGKIKIQSASGASRMVNVDHKTDFHGADPSDLGRSSQKPLRASIQLDGDKAVSIKLL